MGKLLSNLALFKYNISIHKPHKCINVNKALKTSCCSLDLFLFAYIAWLQILKRRKKHFKRSEEKRPKISKNTIQSSRTKRQNYDFYKLSHHPINQSRLVLCDRQNSATLMFNCIKTKKTKIKSYPETTLLESREQVAFV